jgi:hypothetical protein
MTTSFNTMSYSWYIESNNSKILNLNYKAGNALLLRGKTRWSISYTNSLLVYELESSEFRLSILDYNSGEQNEITISSLLMIPTASLEETYAISWHKTYSISCYNTPNCVTCCTVCFKIIIIIIIFINCNCVVTRWQWLCKDWYLLWCYIL